MMMMICVEKTIAINSLRLVEASKKKRKKEQKGKRKKVSGENSLVTKFYLELIRDGSKAAKYWPFCGS